MKNRILLALPVPVLAIAFSFAMAAEPEGFSYRRVYELLYQFESLPREDTSHLEFRARVVNRAGPVPERFRIGHGDEHVLVPVDDHGLFEIPMSPQLAQLDPRMLAEPAIDSPQLGLAILIRLPEEGPPDAQRLLEGIRQTNAVLRARARVHPSRMPQAHGVTLRFSPESDATVAVLHRTEWKTLEADEEGRIDLPLNMEINELRFSTPPRIIFPLFD